jgi:predicted TIM-barrel fold metal-dependent hydrolase
MIIDCHCHAGEGDGLTGPWDTRAPLSKYLRWARQAGIGHTVLFPAFHTDYLAANRQVAQIVARDRRRFSGFAFVHPVRDSGRVEPMVSELVLKHGFCGIKVHRYDARLTREVCRVAARLALPILYDVMGEVMAVELLAAEYPGVEFIIPHLGSFADDWRAQRAMLDCLVRLPNVSTDTSGVRRFELLEEAIQRAGPHKVLFGSDGPWLHPAVELAKVRALGLAAADERLILGGNWLRLTAAARRRFELPRGRIRQARLAGTSPGQADRASAAAPRPEPAWTPFAFAAPGR